MEYNTTLFGEKRSVYTTVDGTEIRQFDIASQNISVQQGYDNGGFLPNTILPVDLRLWEIGEESVLTKISWYKMIDGVYNQWDSTDDRRVPMIFTTAHVKTSSPAFDVQPTGTIYNLSNQCNYRNPSTVNNLKLDAQYPMWYLQAPILTGTAPHFNVSPFILDFNYAGVLALIYVRAGGISYTLKDYIDNRNNGGIITDVFIDFYYGDETHKINSNYNHLEDGTATDAYNLVGGCIINSKAYILPQDIKPKVNYAFDEIQLASRLQSQSLDNYQRMYPLISCLNPASSLRCSVYKDGEHLDNNGYLIQHGDGKYNNNDFAWILKQVALLGFWFTTDNTNITTRVTGTGCTDVNTFLPEIKDGITTGRYWAGTAAASQDAAKWGDDWREKVNYRPGGSSDEYKDRGNLTTTRRNGTLPTNTKNYSISANDFNALCTWCNNGFQVTDNNQFLEDFKGLNPSECIISAMYFPFALLGSTSVTQIKIGNLTAENISANKIDIRVNYGATGAPTTTSAPIKYVLNSGQPITREFNDFRDYAPYTTIDMYVPFCGSISLNPADIYDYPLTAEIIPDLLTGACVGCVYRGDYLLTTVDGQIGVPITLTLGQVGDYQNAITQAAFNLKNANRQMFSSWLGAVASVGAIASGNVLAGTAGLIGSGLSIINSQDNIKKAEYDLSHIPRNFNTVGSLSDSINVLSMPEYVHMIIKRPYNLQGADISQYAHTVGHACNKQGYASDFSGYTLASDIDLSGISATAEELEQIRKYFATGVYL